MWTSPGLVGHVEHLDVGGVPCVGHPANRQDGSLDGLQGEVGPWEGHLCDLGGQTYKDSSMLGSKSKASKKMYYQADDNILLSTLT